jgi:hypothetical protein
MCNHKSAIVMRNGDLLHSCWTDSHEDILEFNGIKDDGKQAFIRVEFSPKDIDGYKDISKYLLQVDQPETPEWWTEDLRNRTFERLKDIVQRELVTEDRQCLIGGPWIVVGAKIHRISHARVLYIFSGKTDVILDSQVGEMSGSSQVGEMSGSSQVGTMSGSSQVGEMRVSSQVGEMRESSQVGEMRESSQVGEMRESSQVGEMRESSQVGKMRESSQVGKMRESSQVGEMWGSSQVKEDLREKKS